MVYRRSIDTGVAVQLARHKQNIRGFLESPYTSLRQLTQSKAPYLFPGYWLRFKFDNLSKIGQVQAPLLIIHGTDDSLIPVENGRLLFEQYDKSKVLLLIDGGVHNDLSSFTFFQKTLSHSFW